jgi:hypothetical protein
MNIMKRLYFLSLVCVVMLLGSCKKESLSDTALNTTTSADLLAEASVATIRTKYGADIGAPVGANDFNFKMNVAGQLGVSCLREGISVPNKRLGEDLVPELRTKYKVLLNFSSPGRGKQTIPFRTDTEQYQKDLNDVLNTFTVMPVVGVIENEESNRFYYSGTAMDYIKQLKAAIPVMHQRGIKVANGGITQPGLCYLVYHDFLAQGKTDSAVQFQLSTGIAMDSPSVKGRGAFIDTLLTNYAKMRGLNFVNFHWKTKTADTLALFQTINYLKKRTNHKVISNELGQLDKRPETLVDFVQMCTNHKFPFIVWYSPDQDAGKIGDPLQYPDGTLTPSGIAYRDYLANK